MNEPHALHKEKPVNAIVHAIDRVHDDIRVVHLKPHQQYSFRAGQYALIGFGDMKPRPYSIGSGRTDSDIIEIHIKRGKGDASLHIMDHLKTGETAQIFPAQGDMIYDHAVSDPILCIAGGLGIAPIKAIIEQAFVQEHSFDIALLWGAADDSQLYLKPYFDGLMSDHEHFHAMISAQDSVLQQCERWFAADNNFNLAKAQIFLSGPPAMVNAAVPYLLDKGALSTKISYDPHPETVILSSL
jgi:NAD(P)H-flavin reductase